MHRFYLAPAQWNADALLLTDSEAHHCHNVLRLEPRDKVVLFDGRGHEITAEITSAEAAQIQLRKLHEAQTPPLRCRSPLARPFPRERTWSDRAEAVEIGAARSPDSFRSHVVRLDDESAASNKRSGKLSRSEAAKHAAKLAASIQRRRPDSFLQEHRRFDLQLIGSLQSDAVPLKKILADIPPTMATARRASLLVVGPRRFDPRGALSGAERDAVRSH